jgi:hypothetical protein
LPQDLRAAADAPASLQYFTLGIAILAAMISAGSLVVSLLGYRAEGPNIKIRSSEGIGEVRTPSITMINSGRGAVDIIDFALWSRFTSIEWAKISPFDVEGEELPYRLDGKSTRQWCLKLDHTFDHARWIRQETKIFKFFRPYRRVRIAAILGDGRIIKPKLYY